MTMNEGFFGQYSVFCVFGSVVGCVVVPLIAQVLQQQSMECVILSAIVLSLTAAHLNKKGGNDATSSYSKVVISNELERKKSGHKKQKNNNQQQQHQQQHQQLQHEQLLTSAEQIQLELEHMQQQEELKISEVERRNKKKRLKKLRKREQRLKMREEENKKQQELEEHYRNLKEKRLKQQKENYLQSNKNYIKSAAQNLEKFCGSGSEEKRRGLALLYANRVPPPPPTKTRTISSNTPSYYQQKIPRFERNRTGSCTSDSVKSSNDDNPTGPNNLTIKCDLSASCSSLSSISSLSSGSASPPISASLHHTNTPWVTPAKQTDSLSVLPTTTTTLMLQDVGNVKCSNDTERSSKSYSNNRVTKVSQKLIPHSSSLFCSQMDGKEAQESQPIVGEYSLFGPRRFATSFAR